MVEQFRRVTRRGFPLRLRLAVFPPRPFWETSPSYNLSKEISEGRIYLGIDVFVAPTTNAPYFVRPAVAQVAAPARPGYELVGLVAVMQLGGLFAAGAVVPLRVLPREARANGPVLVAAPAADA